MRWNSHALILVIGLSLGVSSGWAAAAADCPSASGGLLQQDPQKGTLEGSPLDALPPHIVRLTDDGQRAAWSPDGQRIAYIQGSVGDVFEINVATKATRNLTSQFSAAGFMRAQYMRNGDLLLCGPETRDPTVEDDGRFRGLLWLQRAPFNSAPVSLGVSCWEGYAIDPDSNLIAWTESDIDFNSPDVISQALTGTSKIYTGTIVYEGNSARVTGKTELVDRTDIGLAIIEVQDFRRLSGGGKELVFSAYAHRGGEVLGINMQTKAITGYSRTPFYEEAEGVDPTGTYDLVERDLAIVFFPGEPDIWRLLLDGSARYERLTFFDYYCGYGATNPVVSPDGTRFAFQVERAEDESIGAGAGLLLFDLVRWAKDNPTGPAKDPIVLKPKRY